LALSNDLLERIEPLDSKIETIAKTFPLVKLLKTMPVVGDITAVTVYAEVGDFQSLRDAG
jgi:transposase